MDNWPAAQDDHAVPYVVLFHVKHMHQLGDNRFCNFNAGMPHGRAMSGIEAGVGRDAGYYLTAFDLALPPIQQRE